MPTVILLQVLQMVNSGEMVSCAAWVFSKVFSTRAKTLSAGGRCSPTNAWMMAPDSMSVWNLACLRMRVRRSTGRVGAQVDGVGVVELVGRDVALHDLARGLRVEGQVHLGEAARGALGGALLEGELEAVLLAVLLGAEVHVRRRS